MKTMFRAGGYIVILIGLLHFVSLFWMDETFAYTGITEKMQEMAAVHPLLPAFITVITAFIFVLIGLYGLSASGMIRKLPLLKLGVFTIAAIFITRAIIGYVAPLVASKSALLGQFIFSTIALIVGLLYLIGGVKKWCRKR